MPMGPRRATPLASLAASLLLAVACSPAPSGSPAPSAGASIPASPAPTASPSGAGPSPTPASEGWTLVPDRAAFDGQGLTSVIWTGARFIATGLAGEPTLFDSVDGIRWYRQPAFVGDGWTDGPDLLGAGPGGVVGIGGGAGGPIAVWTSATGLTWTRVAAQDAFAPRRAAFEHVGAVVPRGSGWLAVGGGTYNSVEPVLVGAFALVSDDGLAWTRVEGAASFDRATMEAVARTARGYVAVGETIGRSPSGIPELHPAVWTSPDGLIWSAAPAPAYEDGSATTRTDATLWGVAEVEGRLAVLGLVRHYGQPGAPYGGVLEAVVWWSDGGAWTAAPLGALTDYRTLRLVTLRDGLLVTGARTAACPAAAWTSVGGAAWRCAATGTAFDGWVVTDAAGSPALDVLVGWSAADWGVPAVWTRPAP
jgi:hypothetical protein